MDSTKDGLPQLPSDDEIIDISNQQSRVDDSGFPTRYAVYPSREAPIAFIKCGYVDDGMLAEARNQQFAYTTLQQQPQEGIRIPRVYRVISRGQKVYIVMEYIRGKTIKEQLEEVPRSPRVRECYDQVARAIKFFLSIHIDTDITAPGPVGGGVIRHPLFRWAVAPREYSSVADLQEHVEAIANFRPNNNHRVDFSGESLCFCYSDLYEGNFISTDSGVLYVIDFCNASFLPTSFMTYALDQPRPVYSRIRSEFQLPRGNSEAFKAAGYYFMMGAR